MPQPAPLCVASRISTGSQDGQYACAPDRQPSHCECTQTRSSFSRTRSFRPPLAMTAGSRLAVGRAFILPRTSLVYNYGETLGMGGDKIMAVQNDSTALI